MRSKSAGSSDNVAHLSQKKEQFRYFDLQLEYPDWKGKHVLDFGGNIGNLLQDSPIDVSRYWCIDVIAEAIEKGRRELPQAHWLWYNRYNISFHPGGSKTAEIPAIDQRFDYILAYSVFTHIDVEEMHHLIQALMPLLRPEGALAFTFIDPHYRSWQKNYGPDHDRYFGTNFEWRLERSGLAQAEINLLMDKIRDASWFRLAGSRDVYLEDEPIPDPRRYEGLAYHVFHTQPFMQAQFPGARILPPANCEMQHCCILRRGSF
jgi:hypothetical protein